MTVAKTQHQSTGKEEALHVLLIDQSLEQSELISHFFNEESAEAVVLFRGADLLESISLMNRKRFDIILITLDLRDAAVTTIVSEVQQQAPYTPIVCIVEGDDDAIRNTLFGIGVQDFLQKGAFDRSYLMASLKNAVGRHRLKEEVDKVRELERYLAFHDVLTGLPSRRLFYDRVERATIEADNTGRIMAVLFIDLDDFHGINEQHGHGVGDKVLREVSSRLKKFLRDSDTLARTERDEFAVLLYALKREQDAGLVARKIQAIISEPFDVDGIEVKLTACIGISLYPGDGRDPETLLRNADVAMYRVRGEGPNSVQYFGLTKNAESFTRLQQIDFLKMALENREMLLLYEPVYNLNRNSVMALEVQLRWKHPSAGLVAPDKFMSLAEDAGVIDDISEWLIDTACCDYLRLREMTSADIRLRLPVSTAQFSEFKFVRKLISTCQAYQIPPRNFGVEINEDVIMHDSERALSLLSPLVAAGVEIAVSSYGSGYSSLSALKGLPVNILKIDRSFVKDIPGDKDSMAIVSAIASIAHHFNLSVVAEGVENKEQVAILRFARCDEVQGYYLSRPAPLESLEAIMRCESLDDLHQLATMPIDA